MHALRRVSRRIANWELVITFALAPFLLFPTISPSLTVSAALGIILLWIARWNSRGVVTRRTPLDGYILIIMLMIPIAIWASPLAEQSVVAASRILLGIALYYSFVNTIERERIFRFVLMFIMVGGVVVALVSLGATDWRQGKIPLLNPIYEYLPDWSHLLGPLVADNDSSPGTFHPNLIGVSLAMILPLAIALFLSAQHRLERTTIGLSIFVMIIILILTQSRLGMAALVAASSITLLAVRPRLRRPALLLFGIIALILIFLGPDRVINVLTSNFAGRGFGSWDSRVTVWANALRVIGDFPFTGIGLSTFYPVATYMYVFDFSPTWIFGHTHGIYLQMGVDFGLAGFLSFLGIMLTALVLGHPFRRDKHASSLRTLRAGVWTSLLTYALFGLFDGLPLWTKAGFLIWVILALTMIGHRLAQHSNAVRSSAFTS